MTKYRTRRQQNKKGRGCCGTILIIFLVLALLYSCATNYTGPSTGSSTAAGQEISLQEQTVREEGEPGEDQETGISDESGKEASGMATESEEASATGNSKDTAEDEETTSQTGLTSQGVVDEAAGTSSNREDTTGTAAILSKEDKTTGDSPALASVSATGNTASAAAVSEQSDKQDREQDIRKTILPPGQEPPAIPTTTLSEGSKLTVRFLDVGQGDSTLITCDGESMLIDGGVSDQARKMYAILKKYGIDHLKYIVASHPHHDHCGGLTGALNYARCDLAIAPISESENKPFTIFLEQLEKKQIPLRVPTVGDTFTLGSAVITVLGPTDYLPGEVNNNSLVLRMDYGKTSFLFTGDAEYMEERLLTENVYDLLHTTVLKCNHHGGSDAALHEFYDAVDPDYCVISCGIGNDYGHPHQQTLDTFRNLGTRVYRTDLQGDITCVSDGSKVSFSTYKNPDADVWISGDDLKQSSADGISESAGASASSKSSGGSGTSDLSENTAAATGSGGSVVIPLVAMAGADPSSRSLPDTAQSEPESSQPAQEYVLNTNTHRFHYPDCKSVTQMKEKNKKTVTDTADNIRAQGYQSCGNCNP